MTYKPGDIVVLYSNPTNSMKAAIPMKVELISRKGSVPDLWTVKFIDTGEIRITFVHDLEASIISERPKLKLINGGKKEV